MRILLFSEVTLVKYNVSTILSPIVAVKVRALSLSLWCRGEDKGLPEAQLVLLTAVAG